MFNMEVIFSAISSPPGNKNIVEIEYGGNLTLIEASKHQRIKRFLYVSVLNAEYFAGYKRFFVKYKVEEELKISGLHYTVFRPTIFMDTISRLINKGKAIVYGNQPHPIHFLAVQDFAKIVSASLGVKKSMDARFDVLGPEALTFDDALGMYRRYRHPKLKIDHTALLMGRAMGYIYMKKNPELNELVALMNELDTTPEKADPSMTHVLFGETSTRLHNWLLSF